MLSAVIPVLNEENALPLVLANLRQINKLTSAFFILNGCTDKSAEVIKKSKTACRKIIISYPETLGFDIPRAIGAYQALKYPCRAILFLDGDTAEDIHHCLNDLANAVLHEHVDLALTNCYPYPAKRFAQAAEVLAARSELNRILGLFHDLGLASPSHGPLCVSAQSVRQIGTAALAVPPLFLAKLRQNNGTIKVASALSSRKWYGVPRDDEHNRLIAETIIGDTKAAKNYYLYNRLDREGHIGAHPKRNFHALKMLTGEDVTAYF